jgi:hypothetical protein
MADPVGLCYLRKRVELTELMAVALVEFERTRG